MIILETIRLIIRDHIKDDLLDLYDLLSRKVEMYYLPELYVDTIEAAKENIEVSIQEQSKNGRTKYYFAIIDKGTKKYVGEIGFTIEKNTNQGSLADLGYFIKKEYWGKGITTEAGKKVIDFGFDELDIWKYKTGCLKENIGSEKVMKKLGFIKEGELRKHQYHNNMWKDRLEYGLLRDDWISDKK